MAHYMNLVHLGMVVKPESAQTIVHHDAGEIEIVQALNVAVKECVFLEVEIDAGVIGTVPSTSGVNVVDACPNSTTQNVEEIWIALMAGVYKEHVWLHPQIHVTRTVGYVAVEGTDV